MLENQLSRWGAIAKSLPLMNPGAKVFLVAAATLTYAGELGNEFPPDKGGVVRVVPTIAAAIALAQASRGDKVLLMPGHTETVSSSTGMALNVAGVEIIGIGEGSLRPTITLDTATTATIAVSANNIKISNVIFVANFAAIAALFTLTTATDFQLVNCSVRDSASNLNFVAIVVTSTTSNAADGLVIDKCRFELLAATGATKLVSALGTNSRWTITNNYYSTPTTGTGAVIPIATGKLLTNLLLDGNKFNLVNAATTSTGVLITTNGSTNSGYVSNNQIQVLATTPLGITASSGFVQTNNLYTHTADKSGYVMPVIDASS